jgi:DNA modification methylase
MKIFELGQHRLGFGDSSKKEEVAELMGNAKADLFLIDPPYGVDYIAKNAAVNGGIVHNAVGKQIKQDSDDLETISKLWFSLAKNAYDFTTNEASYLWFACQGGDQMMMMMMIGNAGWKVKHELVWAKSSFVFGRSDYHYQHEPILYGWKKDGKHNFYIDEMYIKVTRERFNKFQQHLFIT